MGNEEVDDQTLRNLLKEAHSEIENVSEYAVSSLAELKSERIIDLLIQSLKDQDKEVRYEAARELGERKNPKAIDPLILALKDEEPEVRKEVVYALRRLRDEKTIKPLIEQLKDQDEGVRWSVALTLGQLGNTQAVLPLIESLNSNVAKGGIVRALGVLGDKRAVLPLIKLLQDKDEEVRKEAISSLEQLGDERAVEPLINILKDKDKWVRISTASALGKLSDKRAVEPLIKSLKDEDYAVRENVAESLGILKDETAILPLLNLLESEDIDGVLGYLARALGRLNVEQAILPLIRKMNQVVVERANMDILLSLQHLCSLSIAPLLEALEDEEKQIRKNAIQILGLLGSKAEPHLNKALNDENEEVRKEASEALKRLRRNEEFKAKIAQDNLREKEITDIARRAVEVLSKSNNPNLLIKTLESEDTWVKIKVIKFLGEEKNKIAVQTLIEFSKDTDVDVRQNAILALGKIKNKSIVKPLKQAFERETNYHVKSAIKTALQKLEEMDKEERLALEESQKKTQDFEDRESIKTVSERKLKRKEKRPAVKRKKRTKYPELIEKYPNYKYAIYFLESDDIFERKIGYSLFAPLFKLLPQELQDITCKVWINDNEKRKMPYSFVKHCEQIFNRQVDED